MRTRARSTRKPQTCSRFEHHARRECKLPETLVNVELLLSDLCWSARHRPLPYSSRRHLPPAALREGGILIQPESTGDPWAERQRRGIASVLGRRREPTEVLAPVSKRCFGLHDKLTTVDNLRKSQGRSTPRCTTPLRASDSGKSPLGGYNSE